LLSANTIKIVIFHPVELIGRAIMNLREIINQCQGLAIHEVRCDEDDYFEVVISNDEMDEWDKILTTILGPARKPKGVEPNSKDLDLTKTSGGIRINQTLFERGFGSYTIIAKFWPWDDNLHTTLKMALLPIS
jgi:hypothetical protein